MERIVFAGLLYGKGDAEHGFNGIAMDMATYDRDFTDLYYAKGAKSASGEADACAASWYEYEQEKYVDVGSRYVFLLPNREGEFVDRFITVKGGIDFRTMPKTTMGFRAVYFDLDGFRAAVGYKEAAPPKSSASSPTRARPTRSCRAWPPSLPTSIRGSRWSRGGSTRPSCPRSSSDST